MLGVDQQLYDYEKQRDLLGSLDTWPMAYSASLNPHHNILKTMHDGLRMYREWMETVYYAHKVGTSVQPESCAFYLLKDSLLIEL